jgi:plasmid stability protein
MSVSLSLSDVPDELLAALREQAARNKRSLESEALAVLRSGVRKPGMLTPSQLLAEVRALGMKTPSTSVEMIREDRDSR